MPVKYENSRCNIPFPVSYVAMMESRLERCWRWFTLYVGFPVVHEVDDWLYTYQFELHKTMRNVGPYEHDVFVHSSALMFILVSLMTCRWARRSVLTSGKSSIPT